MLDNEINAEQMPEKLEGGSRLKNGADKTQPLVSIITVVFRARNELLSLIESVLRLKNENTEFIVIDGGSEDGTRELLRKYESKIDYWVSESDYGIYDAMNKGIAAARGKFIFHLNAGDRLLYIPVPELKAASDHSADAAAFRVLITGKGEFRPSYTSSLRFNNTLHHQGTFFRRQSLPLYDTKYKVFADFDVNQKLALRGARVDIFDSVVASHATGGVSDISSRATNAEFFRIIANNYGITHVPVAWVLCKWRGLISRLNRVQRPSIPRQNNFDLLRLIFASIVVLYHCHDLSLNTAYSWIPFVASSRLAVEGFFAMSGCLIIGSYDQNPTLIEYLKKRARRLLPAYWAALIFTLILGVLQSSLSAEAFLRSPSTWSYVLANLTFLNFLHPTLPGLFTHNPTMPAVNGALWTIKVEVMFYLLVPAIVACCYRFGRWQTLSSIYFISIGFRTLCSHLNHPSLSKQLPGQLCFFAVGALVYFYYSLFRKYRFWMWLTAVISYSLSLYLGWIIFRALGVALGVMCLGLLLPYRRGLTKYGDFSYGTYVFHFPVIQTFVSLGIVTAYPNMALGLICFAVALLAMASWNLVEALSATDEDMTANFLYMISSPNREQRGLIEVRLNR